MNARSGPASSISAGEMITALDTSVLVAIAKAEPSAVRWARALERARNAGDLVICDVVVAELYAFWQDDAAYDAFIDGIGARFLPLDENAAREAGEFLRSTGGKVDRESIVSPIFWLPPRCSVKATKSPQWIVVICAATFRS